MKKYFIVFALILALGMLNGSSLIDTTDKTVCAATCTNIQSGQILTSSGQVIEPGYDEFGYNYQALMFNGRYCDSDRVFGGDYCDVSLSMKWNDAWLSNKDCDGDGLLDRHFGLPTYIGSDAWQTNHMKGQYEGEGGEICEWDWFTKYMAKPTEAYDCSEVGYEIWEGFCVTLSVYNDPCGGFEGVEWHPVEPGFGGLSYP